MTAPALSLHRKLAQVMYEAERIPKNGTAPAAMGGFKFVQVGDAADMIRKALAEHNVSMIPSAVEVIGETEHPTSSGKLMTTLTVRTTWTLTDGESGETAVIQSLGSGADMGDKAAPKAQSNAMKYALLMGFLLSTGDDPEMSDSSDRQARAEPKPERADPSGETIRSLGPIERAGAIAKGAGRHSDLEWRQTPDGYHIGFLLEVGDGKAKPQVTVEGPLAVSLYAATAGAPLLGLPVTVKGELLEIAAPQRRKLYRIVASAIATPEFTIPSTEAATEPLGLVPDDLSGLPDEWKVPA